MEVDRVSVIECPQCGNLPRRGSRACEQCGCVLAERASARSDDDALPAPPAISTRHAVLWGGRSSDGSPIGTAVAEPPPVPMIDKPEPPGMPAGIAESIPAPVTTPGTFMAAWSSPAKVKMRKTQRVQRRRKWAIRLCMLVALAAGVYFAYPYVHTQLVARSVAVRSPPVCERRRRRVRAGRRGLLGPFAEATRALRSGDPPRSLARPMATRSAVVMGSDYRIAIWDGNLLAGTLPKGPLGVLRDPKIGGTGTLAAVHSMQIGGETAYVGTFTSSDALPRRVAVLVHDGRLFVIRVQAESAGTVFDTVVHSFHFVRPA